MRRKPVQAAASHSFIEDSRLDRRKIRNIVKVTRRAIRSLMHLCNFSECGLVEEGKARKKKGRKLITLGIENEDSKRAERKGAQMSASTP